MNTQCNRTQWVDLFGCRAKVKLDSVSPGSGFVLECPDRRDIEGDYVILDPEILNIVYNDGGLYGTHR